MRDQQINFRALSGIDIRAIKKDELVDVRGVSLDPTIPQELRPAKVLHDTGNPYCFRVGDLCVKLDFLDSAPPLQAAFASLLQRAKSGV